jgi:hypothetical protein
VVIINRPVDIKKSTEGLASRRFKWDAFGCIGDV